MLAVQVQQSSQTGQPLFWKEGKMLKVLFTITPTNVNSPGNGNPYVAGGDTLDLSQLLSQLSVGPGWNLPGFDMPAKVEIQSTRPKGGAGSAGLFLYEFAPGTTLQNGTMQIFTGAAAQAALTELAAGNYPANVLNDVIQGEAYFPIP